jgi:hypothetical protein
MVVSFKEKSLELVEEAHRAMSRLEQVRLGGLRNASWLYIVNVGTEV